MATKATFDADFSQFIGELNKVEVKIRDFGPATDKAGAKLERMANSLNGNKLAEQASIAVAAIGRIEGGVGALNNGELRRYGTLIDAATEKLTRQGRDVPPALASVKTALDAARKPAEALAQSAEQAGNKLAGIGQAIAGGLGLGAGLSIISAVTSGITAMKDQISQALVEGQRLNQLGRAFESLQGGAGPATVALNDLRTATRGLVSDVDLFQAANKASLLGLGELGIKTDELADVAIRLGRAMGQGAAKSVDDLTIALGRSSPLILDNLGISVKVGEANERYAASVGKTVEALTDQEKKLAFSTAAMEAAQAKVATLGNQTATLGEEAERATIRFDNFRATVGEVIIGSETLGSALSAVTGGLSDVGGQVGDVARELGPLKDAFTALNPLAVAFGVFAKSGADGAEVLRKAVVALNPALFLVSQAAAAAVRPLREINAFLERGAIRAFLAKPFQAPSAPAAFTAREDGTLGFNAASSAALTLYQEQSLDTEQQRLSVLDREVSTLSRRATSTKANETVSRALRTEEEKRLRVLQQDEAALRRIGAQMGINLKLTETTSLFARQGVSGLEPGANGLGRGIRPGDTIGSTNPLANTLVGLAPALQQTQVRLTAAVKSTSDWRSSLQDVSRSFSELANISGGLDPIVRQVGVFVSGLQAAESLVTGIGKAFNKNFKFGDSKAGQNLAAGIGGAIQGFDVGKGFGRVGGTLAGAAGGALAGAPYAAATGGASVAIGALAGGVGGYFGARSAEKELRKLKDLQSQQLVAQYGTLDALLATVDRLGLNSQTFLERFYGDPKDFAKGISDLTAGLTREKNAADALAVTLSDVQRKRGILSRGGRSALDGVREGGPGADLAKQFRSDQSSQLVGGLTSLLSSGPLSSAAASGAGIGLGAAFAQLRKDGQSVLQALQTLAPAMAAFQTNAVDAGKGSTAEFDVLNGLLQTMNNETLGPFITQAHGASDALAALSNLGGITQDSFSGLSASITDAFFALDRDGKGGVDAVRLLQGPLQNVWQLMQDFGYEASESTKTLIDFASEAGLIGDAFRPSEQKLLQGVDRIVDRLDTMIGLFTGDMVTDARAGADAAGQAILDEFSQVQPRIRVAFDRDDLPAPSPRTSAEYNKGGVGRELPAGYSSWEDYWRRYTPDPNLAVPLRVDGPLVAQEALGKSFGDLVALSLPADQAIIRLSASVGAYRQSALEAGAGSAEQFRILGQTLRSLTDAELTPFVTRAAAAAEAFAGIGQLGRDALVSLQSPFEGIRQLATDVGEKLTEDQHAVLAFAESVGLIGEKFGPAEARLLSGSAKVQEGIERFIGLFTGDLVTDAQRGADVAGKAILEAFAGVRPRIRVSYDRDELPSPPGRIQPDSLAPDETAIPPSAPQAPGQRNQGATDSAIQTIQRASTAQGGDVYMDGRQVGEVVMRHAGGILEFHGA